LGYCFDTPAQTAGMKTLVVRALLASLVAPFAIAVSSAPAWATGMVRVQQRDGSEKTYTDVRVNTRRSHGHHSSYEQGTPVIGTAACTKVGEFLECLPYDATLLLAGSIGLFFGFVVELSTPYSGAIHVSRAALTA